MVCTCVNAMRVYLDSIHFPVLVYLPKSRLLVVAYHQNRNLPHIQPVIEIDLELCVCECVCVCVCVCVYVCIYECIHVVCMHV